jgi:ribosomal protein S18 acetylase RimI-like enzyme
LRSSDLPIRRLSPDDAPAYRELRLTGLREHPDAFTSSFEEECAKPVAATAARLAADSLDAVYGAFAGDRLVAVAGLGRETRNKARHKATLFGMYVAPGFRGRGIADALLQYIIAAARQDPQLTQIVLTVTDTNARATALYERAGFASFGVEPRAIRVEGTYYGKNHLILRLD